MKEEAKKTLAKGDYGHAKRYKNQRLIIMFILFLCILTDVVMTLVIYQTRKSALIVIACVLSLPFAKMLIAYLLCIKFEPLKKDEYFTTLELSKKYERNFLYDISISDTDGMLFYPCVMVYNNNIICYIPDATDNKKIEQYTDYMQNCYIESKFKFRICIVSELEKFEKEVAKIHERKPDQKAIDEVIIKRLLELGV